MNGDDEMRRYSAADFDRAVMYACNCTSCFYLITGHREDLLIVAYGGSCEPFKREVYRRVRSIGLLI